MPAHTQESPAPLDDRKSYIDFSIKEHGIPLRALRYFEQLQDLDPGASPISDHLFEVYKKVDDEMHERTQDDQLASEFAFDATRHEAEMMLKRIAIEGFDHN